MLIHELHDLNAVVQWCNDCRKHKDGHCDECQTRFVQGERRYRSQSFHFHPATVEGASGTRAVQKELCIDCYRKDYAAVYPGSPLPDLPDRGVDEKFHANQRAEERRVRIEALLASLKLDPADQELLKRVTDCGLRFL